MAVSAWHPAALVFVVIVYIAVIVLRSPRCGRCS